MGCRWRISYSLDSFHIRFSKVAEQLMTIAYESGVNLFDTAEVYAAGK